MDFLFRVRADFKAASAAGQGELLCRWLQPQQAGVPEGAEGLPPSPKRS